jgi:hypothetical protein
MGEGHVDLEIHRGSGVDLTSNATFIFCALRRTYIKILICRTLGALHKAISDGLLLLIR